MYEVIGHPQSLFRRPVPHAGNSNVLRQVAPRFSRKLINNRLDAGARAVDIVDDQQGVMRTQVLKQVLQTVNENRLGLADPFVITRCPALGCPNRDVISFDTKKVEAFLHCDPNSAATAPKSDKEIGMKARFGDVRS